MHSSISIKLRQANRLMSTKCWWHMALPAKDNYCMVNTARKELQSQEHIVNLHCKVLLDGTKQETGQSYEEVPFSGTVSADFWDESVPGAKVG